MHEEGVKYAGNLLQGDHRGVLQKLISSFHPAIKLMVEDASNTSMFSRGPMGNRRLDDLDPTLGRIAVQTGLAEPSPSGRPAPVGGPLLESIVSASPVSRYLSIVKKASAPAPAIEKLFNLFTGTKISRTTPQQTVREIRDRLNAMQIEAGARPLSIVSGTEQLRERLTETGDTETLERLDQIEQVLQMLRKLDKESQPKEPRQSRGQSIRKRLQEQFGGR
jgi:hypothetical protein